MGLQENIKRILLQSPSAKKIARGSLLTMLQSAFIPGNRYSSRAQKKLSYHGYNHAWRFFRNSGRSVFTSLFAPVELVFAHDLLPFPLESFSGFAAAFGIAPDLLNETEKRWLSTDFCAFHRTFIGITHYGLLPNPKFLFATSHVCDGVLKSFSEVGRLYSSPLLFINTPYGKSKEALKYLSGQLKRISEEIEGLTGKMLRKSALERVFFYANRSSRALREIGELRRNSNPLMYGNEGFGFLFLWAILMGSRSGAVIAESYRDELKKRRESSFNEIDGRKRVLWLHLKPYFENRLMSVLERDIGAVIVAEEINQQTWEELDIKSPWESLAHKLLDQAWVGSVDNRIANIKRTIEKYNVDGVIHFSHWGCKQSNGAVRIIRDTVNEYGIPFLDLDGDLVDSRNYSEAQYRTRLEGFMEIMEGR
jgi:benzoyl-CoA reductase/2-hydroxyglutaryl-CoA dehydratase subunit BcrC/BadD/HgdB